MKRSLFTKYVILFVGLVGGVLIINAALDLYFVYQDNRRASINVQREKADAAAQRIESFVREIERQIGWVAHAQWALLPEDQRRFDYVRLQRQVPAITELAYIDRQGREQIKVSRLAMDVIGSGVDRSAEPAFKEAVANKVYFGPIYFHKESEPFFTMAVAHGARGGVTVAEVNLKLILDVIQGIRIGKDGYAYVTGGQGRLVAHPDMSLVLRGTDMAPLPQVIAARNDDANAVTDAKNLNGVPVLSAHARIPALDWYVFVELPTAEARQPVINAGLRALVLLALGLLIAALAAVLLARRMVVPIRTLQAGAERIGSGELGHRLSIKTGDELEVLANQFNRSTEALQESYATLEQRVMDRTQELSESLEQQTATAEILRVISQSPTDVKPVLNVVVGAALRFCGAADALIYLRDGDDTVISAHDGALPAIIGRRRPLGTDSVSGRAMIEQRTIQLADALALAPGAIDNIADLARAHGWRSVVAAPMVREGTAVGAIMLRRPETGEFTPRQIELLETFAAQAVIAIENVRLFTELRESLEQQTASSEILQVISQSPTDVRPVLDAVVKAAVRFCGAPDAIVGLRDGDSFEFVAQEGPLKVMIGERLPVNRETAMSRAIHDGAVCQLVDIPSLDPVEFAGAQRLSKAFGFRTALAAPMIRDGMAIGAVGLRKTEATPFTPRQVELLETFAAQAVIAIENVRLFTELREALEQQTATGEILQTISQSPTDVQPVLNAVVKAGRRFCDATDVAVVLRERGELRPAAHDGSLGWEMTQRFVLDRGSAMGQAVLEGRTIHIPDLLSDDAREYSIGRALALQSGHRAVLAAPMMREGEAIGCLLLRRSDPGPFADRQIRFAEAFSAQAVIAIENVRLFTEIQEKSRQLEVASQHKSQFLANMSHELRTPLNAILGYTEMMTDGLYGDLPEKASGVLERVQTNGRHLLGLINDVLDLSKIEAGQFTLAIEEYSAADMISTVVAATESLARTKGLALTTYIAKGLPTGKGDARRLSQVLLNLVGNALKFTDKGGVEIGAARVGERFEFSVTDTGPGIGKADQKRIFDEFQQVDNSSTRKKGGTGLGLSISRKIVELHGGRITVTSELGKGSTFTVDIPVDAAPIKEAAQ